LLFARVALLGRLPFELLFGLDRFAVVRFAAALFVDPDAFGLEPLLLVDFLLVDLLLGDFVVCAISLLYELS